MVLGTVSATNAASQQLRLDYITTKPLASSSAFKDALPKQQHEKGFFAVQDVLLALAFLACGGHHILLRLLSLHLCNEYLSLPKKKKKKITEQPSTSMVPDYTATDFSPPEAFIPASLLSSTGTFCKSSKT